MSISNAGGKKQIPIKEGLLTTPLSPAGHVRLIGSECGDCGEISLGRRDSCSNCGGVILKDIPLSRRGRLWTYTVIRNRPPGEYKGPDPFVPFGLGLVEMPEGIRVLSPIQCNPERISVGMELEMEVYPLYTDDDENEVMAFRFRAV